MDGMPENDIEKISMWALRRIKDRFKPVAIVQFGSSLRPSTMMMESDIDFMAITGRKPPESVEVLTYRSLEIAVQLVSKRELLKRLREGFPVALMAVEFGRARHDPGGFLQKCKRFCRITGHTYETWYENSWDAFSRAVFEYFSRTCAACYLKDCHHSARSFLRAVILKKMGVLCKDDEEIVSNSPERVRKLYGRIVRYRKRGDGFRFRPVPEMDASEAFKDAEAEPLLALEKVAMYAARKLGSRKIKGLKDIVKSVKGKLSHIWLDRKAGFAHVQQDGKFIKVRLAAAQS